jgi:hypothetical protein
MRILLRLVAGFTLLSVVGTLLLVGATWHRGTMPLLLQSGAFGFLTVAGWFLTLVAGGPAVVLLWRPTDLGRIAAAITWGSIGLYYAINLMMSHHFGSNYIRVFVYIAVCGALVALVLSPQARRACRPNNSPSLAISSQEAGE